MDETEIFETWKQAYLYLDRNWGSTLLDKEMTDQKILTLIHNAKQYLEYRAKLRERGLNQTNAVNLGVIAEVRQTKP